MQYGIVQGDSPSHHTPRCDIIAQLPVSNNIAQLPGLAPGLDTNAEQNGK